MQPMAQGHLLPFTLFPPNLLGIIRPHTLGILGLAPSLRLQHPFKGQRENSGKRDHHFTDEFKDRKLGVPWLCDKQVQVGA